MVTRLWARQVFEAAHSLAGVFPESHQCARMHGHRYVVTVTIEDRGDADLLVDYHDMHRGLRDILDVYEHRCLNEVMSAAPTCENLTREIFVKAMGRWPATVSVEVKEQENTGCVVRRERE